MKVLALEVAKVDIGEVIGKRGRTARAHCAGNADNSGCSFGAGK